jgi:5' nucleotidase family
MKLLTIMLMAACFPRSSMCFKLLKYPMDNGHFARRISRFISISNEASSTQVDDVNSAVLGNDESGRYNDVLKTVGLDPSIMKSLPTIPDKRVVTPNDVFCNRELKMSGIRAIGFDMDYTLAQYQQPAFDQLAFDGAVEKLVNKLRYPVEVLDFTYDHTVSDLLV